MVSATSGMLEVFAPQILLYGLSVVMFGMLQAYRRFTGPALAPIMASLVLITSYLVFVPLNGGAPLSRSPQVALLVLSVGATLNVAALVVVGILPVRRLGLRLRPTLRFPSGLAKLVSGLALVGILEFVANDLAAFVNIGWPTGTGQTGALVVFNYANLVFGAVTAVLTLSITTSAFPVLSARDGDAFDRTCAGSTRAVLLMSWLGTAIVATVAIPAAHIMVGSDQVNQLIGGFAAFAPGIAGTALITNLSRVMFALGRLRVAGLALTGNWLVTILASFVLTQFVPPGWEVAALAAGNTIGQTAVAIPLVIATRRIRGAAAVHGVGHAAVAGLIASVFACAAGDCDHDRHPGQREADGRRLRDRRHAGHDRRLRHRGVPARPGRPAGHSRAGGQEARRQEARRPARPAPRGALRAPSYNPTAVSVSRLR